MSTTPLSSPAAAASSAAPQASAAPAGPAPDHAADQSAAGQPAAPTNGATKAPARKPARIRLPHLRKMKERGEPIVMLTAYDFASARLADAADAEMILVGDSLGNVVQGEDTTLGVTVDHVIYHGRIVRRAVERAMIVVDMPFGSYQVSVEDAVANAVRIMKETGAESVKLEGAGRIVLPAIAAMVEVGIPVVGHLGLTPQSVHGLGGFRIQGRDDASAERLRREARDVEAAGACAIVLECMPSALAKEISQSLTIPTIGIGAGAGCDGQVLVWHDVLGLRPDAGAKFVKRYANLWDNAIDGLRRYSDDVKSRAFPDADHEY